MAETDSCTPPAPARPCQRPFLRRWLVRLGLLAGLVAASEGISCLAYRFVDGQWFTAARAWDERQGLLEHQDITRPRIMVRTPDGAIIPMPHFADVHPYLGFSYDPDGRLPRLRGEDPATSWGFTGKADRSPVRKRGPGKVVVGILGASVASIFAGQGLEVLEREMKRSPRFAGQKIEFVSLAIGSFKQPQQLMALNYALALGAEFDIVLNLDGLNEVAWYTHDNRRNGIFHLYPNGWHRFLGQLPDPALDDLLGRLAWQGDRRAKWAGRFQCSPLCCSVTANLVWKLGDRPAERSIEATMQALSRLIRSGHRYGVRGPRRTFRDDDEMLVELVATWERCSLLIDRLCREHGIAYYQFLQPNQYVRGSKPLSDLERTKFYREDYPSRPLIEKGFEMMRQAGRRLREHGVRFHDVSMAYSGHRETFYIDNCCHINRAGAEALALPIAQALLQTSEPPLAAQTQ
jgi:hypothetical protein